MMESVERKRRERREAEKRRKEEERKNSPMRSLQPNGQRDSPARQVQQRRDEERERGAGALRHKLRDEDDGRGSDQTE